MQYGYFDNSRKEYIITKPDTPLPWINYLGADEYCALFSNTAGGYSFYQDARMQRLTRYRYNNVPMDRGGKTIYIRDNKDKDFWSVSWQPVLKDLKSYKYECRHGLGYSIISSEYKKVSTKATYFVPLKENIEIWMLEITNKSNKNRNLSVFSFVEFCLYDALNDMTDYQYNLNIGLAKYNKKNNTVYHHSLYGITKDFFTFFAVNQKPVAFDTQRTDFTGEYGDFSAPRAVVENKCRNSLAVGWSPIASHQLEVNLKPHQTKTLIFILGIARKFGDENKYINKYKNKDCVSKALKDLERYWAINLSKYQTETPDSDVNTMVNIWNQYQCRTTFNWSRSASYYESGIGRGMGFRDSCQDTLGFVHMIPSEVKQRLIDIASTQLYRGDARHQYSPLTKKAMGEGGFSDDHLWLILAVAQYIKETGDLKFLNEVVPYDNYADRQKGAMYEHLSKALDFTYTHLGPHGIPNMFNADWNDCLNLYGAQKNSESVWVGLMFVYTAKLMIEIADMLHKKADKKKFKAMADKMTRQLNKVAWDGAWYKRAFTEKKEAIGSKENKEGQIYLLPQAWAVIADIAPKSRLIKAMDSLNKKLATEHGIMLLAPPYTKYNHEIGSITLYPPGLKENGAIFCHPNPWAMIAECILGRSDLAFKYYKAILPASKNKISEIRKTEPYVYCQMIGGKQYKNFGEGKNSWLTGTAAWNFFAISSYILGIRAEYNGLIIDPVIPKSWKKFRVIRIYRDVAYYIDIKNPKGVSKGIKHLIVDGKKINGNIIPIQKNKKICFVEAVMGL